MKGAQQPVKKSNSVPVITEDTRRVALPDFYSLEDTAQFIDTLKENIDRYGVKTLLYHSEKVLLHLRWIAKHAASAEKILVRVNGSVTPVQRKAYKVRAAETVARKFYSSMSDEALTKVLIEKNKASHPHRCPKYYNLITRENKIKELVKVHIQSTLEVE